MLRAYAMTHGHVAPGWQPRGIRGAHVGATWQRTGAPSHSNCIARRGRGGWPLADQARFRQGSSLAAKPEVEVVEVVEAEVKGALDSVSLDEIAASDAEDEAGLELNKDLIVFLGLSALVCLICSVDRAAMSVTILPMSQEFGWDDSVRGSVNSSFFLGYTVSNLIGGFLVTQVSPKKVLAVGATLWSAFTVMTPLAAQSGSLSTLLGVRFLMGAGEGITFPSIQQSYRARLPPSLRTRALAFTYSAAQLGTIIALLASPLLIDAFDWPSAFWLYGSLGFFWVALWQPLVSDPSSAPAASGSDALAARLSSSKTASTSAAVSTSATEEAPEEKQDAAAAFKAIPFAQMRGSSAFLSLVAAHSAWGWGYTMSLAWLPTFYNQQYGVDVGEAAGLTVASWALTMLTTNAAGWIADGLINSGRLSKTQTRKLMQCGPALIQVSCLSYLATHLADVPVGDAVLLLTATGAAGGLQSSGFGANHGDLAKRYAGILFGTTNACSSLAGSLCVYLTGVVLERTSDWGIVFGSVATVYVLGNLVFLRYGSGEREFE